MITHCHEQRVSGLAQAVLIGLTLCALTVLGYIPIAALDGLLAAASQPHAAGIGAAAAVAKLTSPLLFCSMPFATSSSHSTSASRRSAARARYPPRLCPPPRDQPGVCRAFAAAFASGTYNPPVARQHGPWPHLAAQGRAPDHFQVLMTETSTLELQSGTRSPSLQPGLEPRQRAPCAGARAARG